VDGIIIAGGGTDFGNAAETFTSFGTEVVFIGRPPHPWASVQVDNPRAAEDATSHLAGLGHERIAFIRGPAELASAQDRLRGYRRAVRRHGLVYDERLVRIGDFGEESGYEGACALLGARPRPTAIFAANDRMAIGVLAAASDLGVRVPDELSLVGVDDIVMAAYVRPALTTVAMPAYDLGAAAMRLLAERLEAKRQAGRLDGRPPRVRLPVELVVRDSSAPPPGRRRRAGGGPSNPIPKEQAT
jgi:DNA-binding LacI/PurR family transcriptional regulator